MSRTVLVTGASGAIGGAIAAAFARGGDRVVLCCHRNRAKAEALCGQLAAEGCEVAVVQADLCSGDEVEEMFRQAEAHFGPVEVLVNNAGIAQQKLFCDITEAEWQHMFDVHVKGAFLCCRRALPWMIREKRGCIVNISSMWGRLGASCEVHYSAAKAALEGMTRALAREVALSGVRVNCLAPGAVEGGMMEDFSAADKAALCEEIPAGRLGMPSEVAEAVVFLASDGAAYITGQVLGADGGKT